MTPRRLLLTSLVILLGVAAAALWLHYGGLGGGAPATAKPPAPGFPSAHPVQLSAEEITTGTLAMERLPKEVGSALEAHSAEIAKTAEILESKQARVTGTCAPGSAIRVIAEDGTVSCQKLPRGVASVSSLAGIPRNTATVTAQGSVPGGVGRYQVSGEEDFLVVPVELPDGAVISSFSYVFYDAAPAVDGAAYLYRSDDQAMAVAATTEASEQVRSVTTEEVKLRKVESGRYAYFVYFQVSAAAGAALVPISASISYKLP